MLFLQNFERLFTNLGNENPYEQKYPIPQTFKENNDILLDMLRGRCSCNANIECTKPFILLSMAYSFLLSVESIFSKLNIKRKTSLI